MGIKIVRARSYFPRRQWYWSMAGKMELISVIGIVVSDSPLPGGLPDAVNIFMVFGTMHVWNGYIFFYSFFFCLFTHTQQHNLNSTFKASRSENISTDLFLKSYEEFYFVYLTWPTFRLSDIVQKVMTFLIIGKLKFRTFCWLPFCPQQVLSLTTNSVGQMMLNFSVWC